MRIALSLFLLLGSATGLFLKISIKSNPTAFLAGAAGLASAALKEREELFSPTNLEDTFCLITGGTTGLGLETVKRLAAGGAKVTFTARSDFKGTKALEKVQSYLFSRSIVNENVQYKVLDLDDLEGIKKNVISWDDVKDINVLINNAGVMALPERTVTVDGFEKQVQSNHLGHFLLTSLLKDKLVSDARVIIVSSTAHTMPDKLDLDYFWTGLPNYEGWKSYGQSKLANVLFTRELQKRMPEWTVVTLHPGVVGTDLGRYLINDSISDNPIVKRVSEFASSFLKTPEEGATTQIWLAAKAEPDYLDVRSKYFIDCKPRPVSDAALDEMAAEKLWVESEAKIGLKFGELPGPSLKEVITNAIEEEDVETEVVGDESSETEKVDDEDESESEDSADDDFRP